MGVLLAELLLGSVIGCLVAVAVEFALDLVDKGL